MLRRLRAADKLRFGESGKSRAVPSMVLRRWGNVIVGYRLMSA